MCTIVYVEEAGSTNNMLATVASRFEHGTALAAHVQTAGKGQRGNHWESEPRKNLTFSILLYPRGIVAARQFEISQAVSISVVKVLRSLLNTDDVCIKWPNDIYYRDKKLGGILIENSLAGVRIDRSIVGIGINVNQTEFRSGAPNPVSMAQIAGHEFDRDMVIEYLVTQIVNDFDAYEDNPDSAALSARYRFLLWRSEGFWPYRDNISGDTFNARIAAVAPGGQLTLSTVTGSFRTFNFKEVSPVLDDSTIMPN
ncbi:MAG: biotin--[acetyl-CoA-carboxylase] ligase [Clostridium sp.]|nr:biotin--[acetyl-CoA-carboxylase] ligase [Clostridium sp.]